MKQLNETASCADINSLLPLESAVTCFSDWTHRRWEFCTHDYLVLKKVFLYMPVCGTQQAGTEL